MHTTPFVWGLTPLVSARRATFSYEERSSLTNYISTLLPSGRAVKTCKRNVIERHDRVDQTRHDRPVQTWLFYFTIRVDQSTQGVCVDYYYLTKYTNVGLIHRDVNYYVGPYRHTIDRPDIIYSYDNGELRPLCGINLYQFNREVLRWYMDGGQNFYWRTNRLALLMQIPTAYYGNVMHWRRELAGNSFVYDNDDGCRCDGPNELRATPYLR